VGEGLTKIADFRPSTGSRAEVHCRVRTRCCIRKATSQPRHGLSWCRLVGTATLAAHRRVHNGYSISNHINSGTKYRCDDPTNSRATSHSSKENRKQE
jgi:hypothetical protein